MVINIGINGFGRIGRVVFRTCFEHNDLQVTAINDPATDVEYINYLIKYDSTHGNFKQVSTVRDGKIFVKGNSIEVYHFKKPNTIPWHEAGVQYVVEASGIFTTLEKASGHLECGGVKKVLITSPGYNVPMIVLGVNERNIRSDTHVISCASSTLYCLAPLMKILETNFGIREGFVTSIHSMTPTLKPLDAICAKGKHWREHRSIHQNIIPSATGACRGLSKLLPQLKNKLAGIAFRVPIVNVSLLDISIRLAVETNLTEILKCIEKASHDSMKNIVNLSKEQTVSSDFLTDTHSCTIDISSCIQLNNNFYKLVCWYENEYSYACRVIETIRYCDAHTSQHRYPNRNNVEASTSHKSNEYIRINKSNYTIENIIDYCEDFSDGTDAPKTEKAEERLEKVKREVSKMITITDDLLRKSINNTFHLNAKVKHFVKKVAPTLGIKTNKEPEIDEVIDNAEINKDLVEKFSRASTITIKSNKSIENLIRNSIKKDYVPSLEWSYFTCAESKDNNCELNTGLETEESYPKMEVLASESHCKSNRKRVYEHRSENDIYDKLDSISGTDSNNSFEERKSLVINIKDVINSLDDIAQMEQICKIIEISDDLSDKLLSPLSNKKPNKNWSFKELCESIQLNDFCNNVFGDNALKEFK